MCKYCEEISYKTPYGICYGGPVGSGEIWWINAEQHFHWQGYEDVLAIQYYPWCGRKLKLPHDEPELSLRDEIERLEGRLNHTNKMVGHLVDDAGALLDLISRSVIPSTDRQGLMAELKSLRGKFPE